MGKDGAGGSYGGYDYSTRTVYEENPLNLKMERLLDLAYVYIKEGKRQFRPNTTNSKIDDWIKDYENFKENK